MIRQSVGVPKPAKPMVEQPIPALWIGESADTQAAGEELAMSLRWARERLQVTTAASSGDACRLEACNPAVILLPLAWSGAVGEAELIRLSRCWPLAELVLVMGSAVDGRRRRGPPLPGAVAVPWYEMPGRVGQWCRQRREGVGHPAGFPATSRREDRLLASADSTRGRRGHPGLEVSVAAGSRSLLDAIEMLAVAAGVRVVSRVQGKPPLEAAGDLILWDVGCVDEAELGHLAELSGQKPYRPIVVFEAFPRGATARAVREAGGTHLLGQPLEADVLAETIRWAWEASQG